MTLPKPYTARLRPEDLGWSGLHGAQPRVRVYKNLHKDCFSVVDTWSNTVVAHTDEIQLKEVQFRVQPAGRERVLRTGRKNVHAYVVGIVTEFPELLTDPVRYDPYRFSQFYKFDTHMEYPILSAPRCTLVDGKIYV